MKIALLTSEFPPFHGGIGAYAREMAQAAVQAGHEIVVLAPDYGADQSAGDAARPYRVVRFPGGPASLRGLGTRWAATRRLLRAERFDLVHAADWPFFIPLRLLRRLQPRAEMVLTVHGTEILYMAQPKRKRLLDLIGFWRPGWARWTANSHYTQELLLKTFPAVPAAASRATPLGVSAEWRAGRIDRAAARAALGVADDAFVIASLGRVVPRKGHLLLAEALSRLPADIARRIHWWVIGPLLEADHAAALHGATDPLAAHTAYLGALPDDAVRLRLSAADLFALPGYQDAGGRVEGFGLVFLEAGAYGVPSLAALSGGIPEVVADGESGILVPERDGAALATALLRLIEDPALRARLAQGAEAKAAAATWDTVMHATYED